jgi:hypothetical protein
MHIQTIQYILKKETGDKPRVPLAGDPAANGYF